MLPRLQGWLSQHRLLAGVIGLIGLIWLSGLWNSQPPLQTFTRTLSGSTQQAKVLWFRPDLFPIIVSSSNGTAYALSSDRNYLIAFDTKTGITKWKVDLPLRRTAGVRGLLANETTVFAATTLGMDAFEATTGALKWSTKLGGGHVTILAQADGEVLRDYYGDKLYELNPETGQILSETAKDATIWVSDNVVLQALPDGKIQAVDKQTGVQLWANDQPFYIDEGQEPQTAGTDTLIVGREYAPTGDYASGLCALNLQTGTYTWCRPETYLSKTAIDSQSGKGYVLRADFVLVTLDLQSGNVLGETSFLPNELPEELTHYSQGYAVTVSDGIVIVTFSDSGQTFGLLIEP